MAHKEGTHRLCKTHVYIFFFFDWPRETHSFNHLSYKVLLASQLLHFRVTETRGGTREGELKQEVTQHQKRK